MLESELARHWMSYKEFKDNLIKQKQTMDKKIEPYFLPMSDIMKIRTNQKYSPLTPNHDYAMANPMTLYLRSKNKSSEKTPTNLEYYDIIPNILNGRRSKGFLLADGKLFQPLYDELRNNPNSSYITYANDLIRSGYYPQHLSVLMYEATGDTTFEIINSRLLNYFGAPTVYMQNLVNVNDMNYLLSVDFIGKNEELVPLDEIIDEFDYETHLNSIVNDLSNKLPILCQSKGMKDNEKIQTNTNKIIEDFIYQMVISKYVIGIKDNYEGNYGLLYNKESQTTIIAPLFDLEYYENAIYKNTENTANVEMDMLYIRDKYPNVYTRICDTCTSAQSQEGKENIRSIYASYSSNDQYYNAMCVCNVICENIAVLSKTVKNINKTKEMD